MSHQILPCTPAHIREIKHRLRAADALEITCMGISTAAALWRSYKSSLMPGAMLINSRVAAVWGCGGSPLGQIGRPWLLTAPEVAQAPLAFVKEAKRQIAAMVEIFPKLENYTHAEYAKACRFLEVLGFTLDAPMALGPLGAEFRRFWMER